MDVSVICFIPVVCPHYGVLADQVAGSQRLQRQPPIGGLALDWNLVPPVFRLQDWGALEPAR